MESNLVIPRVAVFWGGENITSYSGDEFDNEPLVYDVQATLQLTNSNPTGSFKWNPSGAAYNVYEKFLKSKIEECIAIKFYYAEGRSIEFAFVWAGHQIAYGNEMTVTVKLRSELDGLVNATPRNITQAYDKGATYADSIKRLEKQYGIEKYNMVRYEQKAKKDLDKAKLNTLYQEEQTFGSSVANVAQQNGNIAFANNILQANISVLAPFTWKPEEGDVKEPEDKPKPNQRYGFILGPGIINSMERTSEWSPPQQNNLNRSRKQPLATDPKKKSNKTKPEKNTERTVTASGSVLGTSRANANTGVNNKENPDGPTKQNLLQEEAKSKLAANIFACPAFMGIKPGDVVYVPSLDNSVSSIEDWVIESVDYQQTDGGVEVSISGGRKFGLVGLMNAKAGEKFKKKAQGLNQQGLDGWGAYAWGTNGNTSPSTKS
jgi:hypothetical protein